MRKKWRVERYPTVTSLEIERLQPNLIYLALVVLRWTSDNGVNGCDYGLRFHSSTQTTINNWPFQLNETASNNNNQQ